MGLCGNTAVVPFWLGHGNSVEICENILNPKIFAKSTQDKLQVKIFLSVVVWNILSVPYRYFCRVKSGYLAGM